jgi:putative DNA primase/helicase
MTKRLQQSDQAVALLYHARAATPFFSRDGQPCASIPANVNSCRILPLRSADFRDWLTANYYSEFESAPSSTALRAALRTLEAQAQFGDAPAQKIDRRVSFEGDAYTPSKIFLDLANAAGEILEITSQGWTVASNLGHTFRQSPSTLALPDPTNNQQPATAPLNAFAALFHLTSAARIRIFTWLISALRPVGPYPILVLRGPVGSGKSTLARALRVLIDPSTATLRRLPARDRELLNLALQNWVLVFDQVHRIPIKMSEALCAISSGDTLELAQPDARDAALVEVARPIILVAPLDETQPPWNPSRSLANRSLTVNLKPLAGPRSESAVWSEFEALRAPALAALADAVSSALHRIRDIDLGSVPRFPDCAAWAAAAAPALGLEPRAISENIAEPDATWIGSDPLCDTLHVLLRAVPNWQGDAATLLAELRALAPHATLPSTPRGLSEALTRIPGITVSKGKGDHGQRTLRIAETPFPAGLRTVGG